MEFSVVPSCALRVVRRQRFARQSEAQVADGFVDNFARTSLGSVNPISEKLAPSLAHLLEHRFLVVLRDRGTSDITRREDRGASAFGGEREAGTAPGSTRQGWPSEQTAPRTVTGDALRLAHHFLAAA